ncbi:MAG: PQQ-dependent sugar dehydrogenase [Gemmatimonadota bacterium]|nr:MAG: PQQ-dependent sugar dehydrogenase [Gemmatimonadota bacterium]
MKIKGLWVVLLVAVPMCGAHAELALDVAFPHLSINRPVDLQNAGDGSDRIFVVEQAGRIHVFENSQDVQSTDIFLDIQNRVNRSGNEEGLLGLAFHPDYEHNGYFYVDYTASNPRRTVIARYTVSGTDPDVADVNSEIVLLEIEQPFSNHNGGQISFGPDGYLYISVGDGGAAGDPQGNGQNLQTLLGAILRIDVDNPDIGFNYSIPSDNPFAHNQFGYAEEIYAYGLRNPWRFSFDSETGWLWAADVGQNTIEEIDIIEKGKNYGWDIMEGSACFEPPSNCDTTGLTFPIWEYDHSLGQSITGGFVYRGTSTPQLTGKYLYADYVTGRIWSLQYDGQNPPSNTELFDTDLNISSFGVDEDNELYFCAFDGSIYKISSSSCMSKGDANGDCAFDVLDALMVVNVILDAVDPTPDQFWSADCNGPEGNCDGDGQVDVLDALKIVNLILGLAECP